MISINLFISSITAISSIDHRSIRKSSFLWSLIDRSIVARRSDQRLDHDRATLPPTAKGTWPPAPWGFASESMVGDSAAVRLSRNCREYIGWRGYKHNLKNAVSETLNPPKFLKNELSLSSELLFPRSSVVWATIFHALSFELGSTWNFFHWIRNFENIHFKPKNVKNGGVKPSKKWGFSERHLHLKLENFRVWYHWTSILIRNKKTYFKCESFWCLESDPNWRFSEEHVPRGNLVWIYLLVKVTKLRDSVAHLMRNFMSTSFIRKRPSLLLSFPPRAATHCAKALHSVVSFPLTSLFHLYPSALSSFSLSLSLWRVHLRPLPRETDLNFAEPQHLSIPVSRSQHMFLFSWRGGIYATYSAKSRSHLPCKASSTSDKALWSSGKPPLFARSSCSCLVLRLPPPSSLVSLQEFRSSRNGIACSFGKGGRGNALPMKTVPDLLVWAS